MNAIILSLRNPSCLHRDWANIPFKYAIENNMKIIKKRYLEGVHPVSKNFILQCIRLSPESFPSNIEDCLDKWEAGNFSIEPFDKAITIF